MRPIIIEMTERAMMIKMVMLVMLTNTKMVMIVMTRSAKIQSALSVILRLGPICALVGFFEVDLVNRF